MTPPLFVHQLETLRRRQEIEDEEVLGRTVKRRRHLLAETSREATGGGTQLWRTDINWFEPTFLVEWSRNPDGVRIPFVGLTSIAKCEVPRSRDGRTHPRYPDQCKVAEDHFGYIERQFRADHLDYIERDGVRDEHEDGEDIHVLTNIHRNPAKRREFIRKVEEFEQQPHAPRLKAWSSDLAWWEAAAAQPVAPDWVREAAKAIRTAVAEGEGIQKKKAADLKPFPVDLGITNPEAAYDRLIWCDQNTAPGELPKLDFESKYGGRIQYRLVFELPFGLSACERFEIARAMARWCKKMKLMYVIAIHKPDGHNDSRNYHVHCDFYDRPCKWKKAYQMWDFDIVERAPNGDLIRPFRQFKPAAFTRDPTKKLNRQQHGEEMLKELRRVVVDESNRVLETAGLSTRYHVGPLSDLGIKITSMKKLGGAKMAAERIGIRTDDGTHNADAIWSDREAQIEVGHRAGLARNRELIADLRTRLRRTGRGHNITGMRLHANIASLDAKLNLLRHRRTELERVEFQFEKARSRAELVLREARKAEERRGSERSFKTSEFALRREDCIADARQHLDLVDGLAPTPQEFEAVRAEIVRLEKECNQLHAEVLTGLDELPKERKGQEIRLTAADLVVDESCEPLADYDLDRARRLEEWLKANKDQVRVEGDTLVIPARQAMLTIIARHQASAEVRELLSQVVLDRLLTEARNKRWRVLRTAGSLQFAAGRLEHRPLEREILSACLGSLRTQEALQDLSDEQDREIRSIITAIGKAERLQVDGQDRLVNDDFPGLQERIENWRFFRQVEGALAARQQELKQRDEAKAQAKLRKAPADYREQEAFARMPETDQASKSDPAPAAAPAAAETEAPAHAETGPASRTAQHVKTGKVVIDAEVQPSSTGIGGVPACKGDTALISVEDSLQPQGQTAEESRTSGGMSAATAAGLDAGVEQAVPAVTSESTTEEAGSSRSTGLLGQAEELLRSMKANGTLPASLPRSGPKKADLDSLLEAQKRANANKKGR